MSKEVDVVIVGAGYVGLTLALQMAYRGVQVLNIDIDKDKINKLSNGKITIGEVGVAERLKQCLDLGKIEFDISAPKGAPAWIIATSYFPGKPKLFTKVFDVVKGVGDKPPLIITRGTVPVGYTRRYVLPYLEKKFKGKVDEQFYLASCPERTLSGAALEELEELAQLIGATPKSFELAKELFEKAGIKSLNLPSIEAGELAKVFANYARIVQFNLTNFLAVLCHQFNLKEDTMVKTISAGYKRLNFLKPPGPGVGGFCLPKDSLILHDGLKEMGNDCNAFKDLSRYPLHQFELNEEIIQYHKERVVQLTSSSKNILALGLAFKGIPKTDDLRNSVGVAIVRELIDKGKNVNVYDLTTKSEKLKKTGFILADFPIKMNRFDALLILNNDPDYKKLILESLEHNSKDKITLYDPWQLIVREEELIFQREYPLQLVKERVNQI